MGTASRGIEARESGAAGIRCWATFKQASEGSGKRVTINFCAACGTKLCLDSAQNGTVIPGGVSTFRQHTMLNDGAPVAPTVFEEHHAIHKNGY
jgi:hypothetical protein